MERAQDLAIDNPAVFLLRSEEHGLPQARHRVIIMGVREVYLRPWVRTPEGLEEVLGAFIEEALSGPPRLRSGLSKRADVADEWFHAMEQERVKAIEAVREPWPEVAEALDDMMPGVICPGNRTSTRPVA